MKVQHNLIQLRAYEIWARSGYPDGQHNEHWEQAEKELLGEAPEGEASAGVEPSTDAGAAADGDIWELSRSCFKPARALWPRATPESG